MLGLLKRTFESRDLSYNERLRRLNLTPLKDRRTRGDFIEMFKAQKGLEKIEWVKPPLLIRTMAC